MIIENIILIFSSFHQNNEKGRGKYQIIIVSLTSVSDALFDGISLLCQKVMGYDLGFYLIQLPFGLFIFYLVKC